MASSLSNPGEFDFYRLFNAAYTGDLPLLKRLAKEISRLGLKIEDVKDGNGVTALHAAAIGGRTHVCKYLVEEVKFDIDVKGRKSGSTPLHVAILRERFQTVVYLLDKGANPNAVTHKRHTALHYAADKGPKKLVKLLIMKGAEVDAMTDTGTPLMVAAYNDKKDFVKVLLDNNADPNLISHDLCSPLVASVIAQSIECVKMLLKAGANPNLFGSKFFSPLNFAAFQKDTEIIKCLLNAGADPNVTDNFGMTPVEVAALYCFLDGVTILFPVTSPIPTISDWTIAGLIKHVCSDEAIEERKQKGKEQFLLSKSKGLEAFNRKDYLDAIRWYTEAMYSNPFDSTLLSNRSLCWTRLNEGGLALKDAEACIERRPDWPKAYYRKGAALMLLKHFEEAADVFFFGWMLDPSNEELEHAFRGAIEAKLNKLHLSGNEVA